jgi:hypothetical protein
MYIYRYGCGADTPCELTDSKEEADLYVYLCDRPGPLVEYKRKMVMCHEPHYQDVLKSSRDRGEYVTSFQFDSDLPMTMNEYTWGGGSDIVKSMDFLLRPVDINVKNADRAPPYNKGLVSYHSSNCVGHRDDYVRELSYHVKVDGFFKCLHNQEFNKNWEEIPEFARTGAIEELTTKFHYKVTNILNTLLCIYLYHSRQLFHAHI